MVVDSADSSSGDIARITSKSFPTDPTGYCLSWYYHMLGSSMGTMNVYAKVDEEKYLLWSYGEDVGDVWNYAQAEIPSLKNYKSFSIVYEGIKGTLASNMAIDDIAMDRGKCPMFGACDFESNDFCSWSNVLDARDQLDWTLGRHRTLGYQTGPSYDHTQGNGLGTYAYLKSNYAAKEGYRAILESTNMQATPSYGLCLEFWYHMYGAEMGALNVFVNASNQTSLLWTQYGNKGDMWFNGQVTVLSSKSFRLSFEAIRGNGSKSEFAIDDIDFIEKSCPLYPVTANPANLVTITVPTTTRTLRPLSSDDCDFEKDWCYWKMESTSTFNYSRVQGTLGSKAPGPLSGDHTYGTPDGWYMTLNMAGKQETDKARLVSSFFYSTKCMEFYYYLDMRAMFTFSVYSVNSNKPGTPIWQKTKVQGNGNSWRLGRVTVNSTGFSSFQVMFEMTNITNGLGDDLFGLDDIFFTTGVCSDGSKVDQICSFSNGNTCNYNITSSSNAFKWTIYSPDLPSNTQQNPLSINDHTTDSIGSGFLFASSASGKENDSAQFTSPIYAPFGVDNPYDSTRCFEFYYFMTTDNAIRLNLVGTTIQTYSKTPNVLWSRSVEHSGYWWKASQNVRYITNYTLGFEAIVGKGAAGVAAIDDVKLRNGNCSSLVDDIAACDFDSKDLCSWANTADGDELDWELRQGSTSTYLTGPTYDHTTAVYNGFYVYM